jgi:hypothetical protein
MALIAVVACEDRRPVRALGDADRRCAVADFEIPRAGVGDDDRRVSYVDQATGTTFRAEPTGGFDDGRLLLLRNSDGCVQLTAQTRRLPTQRLGTTRAGASGLSGFAIRATPAAPLAAPARVAVEVYSAMNTAVRLRLFDAAGRELVSVTQKLPLLLWPCDRRAGSFLTLVAEASHGRVASAVVDAPVNETGMKTALTIDSFAFSAADVAPTARCPWDHRESVPECRPANSSEGDVRYLCIARPPSVDSCETCDLSCLRSAVYATRLAANECVPIPSELLCGPNPFVASDCCYLTLSRSSRCAD